MIDYDRRVQVAPKGIIIPTTRVHKIQLSYFLHSVSSKIKLNKSNRTCNRMSDGGGDTGGGGGDSGGGGGGWFGGDSGGGGGGGNDYDNVSNV